MTGSYLTNFSTGQLLDLKDIFITSMGQNFLVSRVNMEGLGYLLSSDGAIRVFVVLGVLIAVSVYFLKYPFLWKK